jgi:uncharacterized protein (DUF305 family)
VIRLSPRGIPAALLLSSLIVGCSAGKPADAPPPATAAATPAADHSHHMTGLPPVTVPKGALYTEADVHFMQGMIAHHGQAIHMSRLAMERGATPRVLRLATKIDQSQIAEIQQMQDWLRANNQVAPDSASWRTISMPGMLTAEQLAELNTAKGTDFDRKFLTLMIQHHEGALKMVADLLSNPLAAQDVNVSVFATDVEVVQTAEIGIMYQLLEDL